MQRRELGLRRFIGHNARMNLQPFHLAFPVHDLDAARTFYGTLLGCPEGRSSDKWVDFNFFGHQIVCHLVPGFEGAAVETNRVDGDAVPSSHFGMGFSMSQWTMLRDRLEAAGVEFLLSPKVRFAGEPGEQATMFIRDPSGNALEFKAFADMGRLFATAP